MESASGVRRLIGAAVVVAVLWGSLAGWAEDGQEDKGTGTTQSTCLYTPLDATSGGGVRGRLISPGRPVRSVFALPTADFTRVYRGEVLADGEFRLTGLPADKYDLLVLCDDCFFEGLTLSRTGDTLTEADRQSIRQAVTKSTPFFNTKSIHRLEGATAARNRAPSSGPEGGGAGAEAGPLAQSGKARGVLQEVRTRPVMLQSGEERSDIQVRSIKLALVEDVGTIGWSLVNTREIVRQEVRASDVKGLLAHRYNPKLGGVRVIDTVKDLGTLAL